jgi:hypothetical protein
MDEALLVRLVLTVTFAGAAVFAAWATVSAVAAAIREFVTWWRERPSNG